MNYGIPSLMEFTEIEPLARFCANHGFSFLEMNMTFPWFQSGSINADILREVKKKYGIGLTIHLHDQVNPFEFSPEMRRGALENIRFAMGLAREAEIEKLTMHLQSGSYASVNGVKTYLYEQCLDLYLGYVLEFRSMTDRYLDEFPVAVCIENTSGFHAYHQEAIEELLKSEHFALTFDIGHNYKAGGHDEDFILAHAEKLRHFHIHDCSFCSNHLAFGAGGLDLPRYLKMAEKYNCSVVAEVKESKALLLSRDYLIRNGMWEANC